MALLIVLQERLLITYYLGQINVCSMIFSLRVHLRFIPKVIMQNISLMSSHAFILLFMKKLQGSRAEIIYRQHWHANPISIMVGDTIMKSVPERHFNLSTKFTGPFLVTDMLRGNKFKLLDTIPNLTDVVYVQHFSKVDAPCPAPTILANDSDSIRSPPESTAIAYRLKVRSARHQL